jgi:hypothetical protein
LHARGITAGKEVTEQRFEFLLSPQNEKKLAVQAQLMLDKVVEVEAVSEPMQCKAGDVVENLVGGKYPIDAQEVPAHGLVGCYKGCATVIHQVDEYWCSDINGDCAVFGDWELTGKTCNLGG